MCQIIAISTDMITNYSENTINKYIKQEEQNTYTNFVFTMLVIMFLFAVKRLLGHAWIVDKKAYQQKSDKKNNNLFHFFLLNNF